MDKEFYTVQEAALGLDIAEVTVRSAINEGRLPFTLMYGRKLISRADLEAYRQRTRPNGVKPKGRPRNRAEGPEDDDQAQDIGGECQGDG